jgi:alkaline phosphatase
LAKAPSGKARNIIRLIGDGMGPSHVGATWLYSQRTLGYDRRRAARPRRVGWGSQTHIATPLYAFGMGPGSEKIVGYRHHTELFFIRRDALGNRQAPGQVPNASSTGRR